MLGQYCVDEGVPHPTSNTYQLYIQCGGNVRILDEVSRIITLWYQGSVFTFKWNMCLRVYFLKNTKECRWCESHSRIFSYPKVWSQVAAYSCGKQYRPKVLKNILWFLGSFFTFADDGINKFFAWHKTGFSSTKPFTWSNPLKGSLKNENLGFKISLINLAFLKWFILMVWFNWTAFSEHPYIRMIFCAG